ncbi:galactose mutarotase-like domain-containing protein [Zalerion maritima]|uniref:Glucose-6-phosphate 1-epimerase n=1 Tax=Zalerion maritima TaxID=339359 RepID=A0AAD5RSR7_9PEZI|nr:galactose mutarotase-like domain-containing protein [Zalerion maritima]
MVDRPNKPAALATTPGLPPQAQVNISHGNQRVTAVLPTGESVEILLHGATVISWKAADDTEKLWVSNAAKLDGSKPVRGGIPLVFPVFGTAPDHAATSKLPQHGFARSSRWEFLGKSTSESGDASVKLDFGLSSASLSDEVKALWPYDFNLLYSVTLDAKTLTTSMVVTNQGNEPFEFQMLLHTYFKIKDISSTTVTGLEGASYVDKVDNASVKTESASEVSITGETDRIYTPVKKEEPIAIVEGSSKTFNISRDNLEDTVVWNPWTEKAAGIGDFAPKDGYKNMICVEAGSVQGWVNLENGDQFEGAQTITSL